MAITPSQPTQAIVFKKSEAKDILSGARKCVIRAGYWAYREGETAVLCDPKGGWCAEVGVQKVSQRRLRQVPLADLQMDGYADHDAAAAALGIATDGWTTTIMWEGVLSGMKVFM